MENTINQRIELLVEQSGKTKNFIANQLDISATYVKKITSGKSSPGYEIINGIISLFPNLSVEWLILGNGPMYREESSLVSEPMVSYGKYTEDKLDLMSKLIECQEEKDRYRHLLEANNISPAQRFA